MRILIVEDDSRLLTQLDILLQKNGYSVDLADDGAKALFLLQEHTYDLAIIDIGLPVVDGFEVIQKARKNEPNINFNCERQVARKSRRIRLRSR
jgi:two-component system response regulator PhoP